MVAWSMTTTSRPTSSQRPPSDAIRPRLEAWTTVGLGNSSISHRPVALRSAIDVFIATGSGPRLMQRLIENLRLDGHAMRYSKFVPRLYNYCLSLGFRRERMMPSRAFCSDESQGYPVILIAQHFGTFPFDHGLIGGNVALDRHGPHAHHGEDLVIIQASHVGYDADTKRFGVYQRQRTTSQEFGDNCGQLCAVLHWYQFEFRHACEHILCGRLGDEPAILIGNQFLDEDRPEGLFLNLDLLIDRSAGLLKTLSTSNEFRAAPALV